MRVHLDMHKSRLIGDDGQLIATVETVEEQGLFLHYVTDLRNGRTQERHSIAFTRAHSLLINQAILARIGWECRKNGIQRITMAHVRQVIGATGADLGQPA